MRTYKTAEHFVKKYDFATLQWFFLQLIAHKRLEWIGGKLKPPLSKGRISQLANELFEPSWKARRGTKEFARTHISGDEWQLDLKKKILLSFEDDDEPEFMLIAGNAKPGGQDQ